MNQPLVSRTWPRRALSVAAGLAICAGLPPWGWWPLTIAGIALWVRLLDGRTARQRFATGAMVALAWYLPSTLWMVKFSPAGWPLGVALWFPLVVGATAALCPPQAIALALPATIVISEWVRWHAPFGGVPLSMLAYTQARGPLLPVARVIGTLGVSGAVAWAGGALAALSTPDQRRRRSGAIAALALLALTVGAIVAPSGERVRVITAAAVQGGGPQQTRADATDFSLVFGRHLTAAERITTPVDLVVFPENIVNISGSYVGSTEQEQLTELAKRLHATVISGIVEDRLDPKHFWNFAIGIGPDGAPLGRYDKVRRVPFGEYVPIRPLFETVAKEILPPRDDVEGTGPAVIGTPLGPIGVVISWEVFFPRRVREALHHDAEIVLNPTNGSSYWLTQVQSQQIASSALRAVESGRWVIQAAPTGFSAIIDPDGVVQQRSGVSEARVLEQTVELRRGRTLAMWWGEAPALLASLIALAWAWAWAWARSMSRSTQRRVVAVDSDTGPCADND